MRTSEIIRQAIAVKPPGAVFSSADFLSVGTRAAVDQALFRMMSAGIIERVARGLYAAAGQRVDAQTIAHAVAQKTGEQVGPSPAGGADGLLVVPTSGLSRTVKAARHTVQFRRMSQRKVLVRVSSGIYTKVRAGAKDAPLVKTQSDPIKPITLPEDLNALPLKNVSMFVQRFAMSRDVQFKRTGLDPWAEAVTRASCDDVTLDETGKLLVALKKKHLINGRQMARLMSNHLSELLELDGAHSADDNMAYAADDAQAKQRYEEASQLRNRSQQG